MSSPVKVLDFANSSIRTLHLTWVAFFITFVVWFSHAPLMAHIKEAFDLSSQEVKALLMLNVALTIPARIVVGMLVDKYGPRIILTTGTVIFGIGFFLFATVDSLDTYFVAFILIALGSSLGGWATLMVSIVNWFDRHRSKAVAWSPMA